MRVVDALRWSGQDILGEGADCACSGASRPLEGAAARKLASPCPISGSGSW